MPDLPDLLSLLHDAHRDVEEMFAEIRDWFAAPKPDFRLRAEKDGAGVVRLRSVGDGVYGQPAVMTRRVWYGGPGRVRVEVSQARVKVKDAIRDGTAWWRWDCEDGERTGTVDDGVELPPILDIPFLYPARYLASMHLEVTGTGTSAGRDVLAANGTPRDAIDGTERHSELEFDLEHGTPLRLARFEAGAHISTSEVHLIDYAPGLDPALFRFDYPDKQREISRPRSRVAGSLASLGGEHRVARVPLIDPKTIWLTGLPGAGKTTLAAASERLMIQLGVRCCVLDGDRLRAGLSSDLGLSREDRGEQARRVAHIAAMLADSGIVPIVALVSPYSDDRELAREIHRAAGVGFLEVWVDTPLEVCVARDPKGLYSALGSDEEHRGDGSGLTGLTAPYEAPTSPDLRVRGHDDVPREAALQIVDRLVGRAGSLAVDWAADQNAAEVTSLTDGIAEHV